VKKTIENTADGRIIHTTNGVDTRSTAVYVKQIKSYDKPLANGFNLELAQAVIDQIKATPLLWNQDVWRAPFDTTVYEVGDYLPGEVEDPRTIDLFKEINGRKPVLGDLQELLSDLSEPNAKCGTAMCFAGWVAELTGANFVTDAAFLKIRYSTASAAGNPELAQIRESARLISDADILVTREEAKSYDLSFPMEGRYAPAVLRILAARGFTPSTHRVVVIDDYAEIQLGLLDGDGANLFSGTNSFSQVEQIVAHYAKEGPDASRVDLELEDADF